MTKLDDREVPEVDLNQGADCTIMENGEALSVSWAVAGHLCGRGLIYRQHDNPAAKMYHIVDGHSWSEIEKGIEEIKTTKLPQCSFCEQTAIARMPQSSDEGKTVKMVNCCTDHREGWWDAADWDGRHLEVDLTATGKVPEHHLVQYVIRSLSEGDKDLDGAAGAFWSNKDGWGHLDSATRFTTKERMEGNLPISSMGDSEWMLVEEALNLTRKVLKDHTIVENGEQLLIDAATAKHLVGNGLIYDQGDDPSAKMYHFVDGHSWPEIERAIEQFEVRTLTSAPAFGDVALALTRARVRAATSTVKAIQSNEAGQVPQTTFPVLFELDPESGEATGTVMPFCSTACRDACGGTQYAGFRKPAEGTSTFNDFGFDPHCEECGEDIKSVLSQGKLSEKQAAEEALSALDMLTRVERWMSGYGTKSQVEMRQEVRAVIAHASAAEEKVSEALATLVEAAEHLHKELFAHHKMNVKKDYSLMAADAAVGTAIFKAKAILSPLVDPEAAPPEAEQQHRSPSPM